MQPNMNEHISAFKKIIGDAHVTNAPEQLKVFGRDWTTAHTPNASLVLLPGSTKDVSAILKYCNEHHLAVIPSGGRTGLAGGAVATQGEIILSLNRMNKIENLDAVGMTIEVQAGVTCQAVQQAAAEAGVFFALDLASKGSCQIGGNIATNAGGLKLIRYGGAREQILGLEVVLANGEVLDMNYKLRKNNTGVDLKQIFIASEGTLGVVTRAVLRLMPKPRELVLSCMVVESFADIPKLVQLINMRSLLPTAFEFFSQRAMELVLKYHTSLSSPFQERGAYYVLLELDSDDRGPSAQLEPLLEEALEKGFIKDAVIATSSAQFKSLWGLRENISESVANYGHVRKNDISLPIDALKNFVDEMDAIVSTCPPDIELVLFGHIGDGNLHVNYIAPPKLPKPEFNATARKIEERIFALLPKYRGSISAEHGIGLLKKADLKFSRTPHEIEWMHKLKGLFDPKGILNPGKIL